MQQTIDRYLQTLDDRGLRPGTVVTTGHQLRSLLDPDQAVGRVTAAQLRSRYQERVKRVAVATHRGDLKVVQAWARWCVEQGFLARDPAGGLKPVGRSERGKPQLRAMEARRLYSVMMARARSEDDGALGVMAVLMLGVRSSEILDRRVRDVDVAGGVVLWIEGAKTRAGERRMDVPEPLAGLLARRAADRPPGEWLLPADTISGHRTRGWLCNACVELCEAAGVPRVTPQGLRGTWSTLAVERGVSTQVVAAELGHAGPGVTRDHYLDAGAEDRARAKRMLRVVQGGCGTIEAPIVPQAKTGQRRK